MKTRRSGTILMLLGVILAIAVGGVVFVTTQKASNQSKVDMSDVLVAALEIPERAVIEKASLVVKSMPVDLVPAGALTSADQAAGQMTTSRIYPGEILLGSRLADTSGQSGLAYTLDHNQVVVTFPASDILGTGALRVGDTIDILVTLQPSSSQTAGSAPSAVQMATTQISLQNLKILGIGSVTTPSSSTQESQTTNNNTVLTFAVAREDALVLKALKDSPEAILDIALRAAGDDSTVKTDAVTIPKIVDKYQIK